MSDSGTAGRLDPRRQRKRPHVALPPEALGDHERLRDRRPLARLQVASVPRDRVVWSWARSFFRSLYQVLAPLVESLPLPPARRGRRNVRAAVDPAIRLGGNGGKDGHQRGRPFRHLKSRARTHPFPSLLLRSGGRWRHRASRDARLSAGYGAGWGVARCFDPSRIARPSSRTWNDPYLLSAPHPPLRCPADRWV